MKHTLIRMSLRVVQFALKGINAARAGNLLPRNTSNRMQRG